MISFGRFSYFLLRRLIHKSGVREGNDVKIALTQGVVVGKREILPNGQQYDKFLGVPYAVPPLGKLRFRSPQPLKRFDVPELDCRNEKNVAYQIEPFSFKVVGSENCLFLNIYVPRVQHAERYPLPVMVWLHGGGFVAGSGNSENYFPERLIQNDVIVITLNYRLGALGFLYLPEDNIYGNAGLKDQRLTLEWIQENISIFNGDSNNVTLFGESAGACAVHYHLYGTHATKLFHRAILQSGTGNMEWVCQLRPEYKTRKLAELLGYQTNKSEKYKLLSFLQSDQVSPSAILSKTLSVITPDEKRRCMPFVFKPVVEDVTSPDVFIDAPISEMLCKRLRPVPLLIGYNSAEGLTMLSNASRKVKVYDKDLERYVPRNLVEDPNDPAARDVAAQIRKFYFKGKRISLENLNSFADLLTDYHFNMDLQFATEMSMRHQPNSAPLYFYRFDYVGGRNQFKKMFGCEHLRGACHGDELFYLFQNFGDTSNTSNEDISMSKNICELWTNFARHGTPTPTPKENTWRTTNPPKYNSNFCLDFYIIDRLCEMRSNPDSERMNFWSDMYKIYNYEYYTKLKKL